MPILLDDHNDDYRSDYRRLVRLSDREAFDPNTGDRYRIERRDQPDGPGGGLLLAILLGMMLWLLTQGQSPAPPAEPLPAPVAPVQPDGYPVQPYMPIG